MVTLWNQNIAIWRKKSNFWKLTIFSRGYIEIKTNIAIWRKNKEMIRKSGFQEMLLSLFMLIKGREKGQDRKLH